MKKNEYLAPEVEIVELKEDICLVGTSNGGIDSNEPDIDGGDPD